MDKLTLGSLFDGSGGFPLGGLIAGITPVWASEIEPFPIRVTTKRMPFIKHYGDVSAMDGGRIEPVDIITFGSPCQDMSVAGKRSGLDGERSGLFYEAVRIVKEMRCATNGKYPRYAVWENVPGAFSSNGGEDFKAVLEAILSVKSETVSVPRPERWPSAGEIVGDGVSLAWRVLDAQYWGVPQRRKRIYLVADLAGESAGKILFESEGMSGYSAEGFRAWQRAAGSAAPCTGGSGFCLSGQIIDQMITAELYENHSQDTRYTGPLDTAPTVLSTYGTGGNNQPFVVGDTPKTLKIRSGCEGGGKGALIQEDRSATLGCNNDQTVFVPQAYGIGSFQSKAMLSDNPHAGIYEAETSRTLDVGGGSPSCNQGGIAVVEQMPEVYAMTTGSFMQTTRDLTPTLAARDYKDPSAVAYSVADDTAEPRQCRYSVRRLTPTECARLQGFPDWWCSDLGTEKPTDEELYFWYKVFETHRLVTNPKARPKSSRQIAKWLKDPHSDSAEYKMWGNGVALPCVVFALCGIAYYASLL